MEARSEGMTGTAKTTLALGLAYAIAMTMAVGAQETAGDGPRYTNGTNLVRPTDYREWIFLGSGLGMTYDSPSASQSAPQFTTVFVNPSSYRSFMQTGKWPDRTIFVLEIRNSSGEGSINKSGRFQAGLVGIEAEVKDSRFPDGWAFFDFGSASVAAPLAGERVARCIECHTKHTAVERTFVQFYPTLLEVARQKGTLKPGF
jgi:Cytochrome P460